MSPGIALNALIISATFPPRTIDARLELTNQGMVRDVGAAFRLKSAYLRGPIGMGLLGGNPTCGI